MSDSESVDTIDINGESFKSCSEVKDALGSNCWCWEIVQGDYSQIFTLLGLEYLIYLSQFLLIYGACLNSILSVSSLYIPLNTDDSGIPKAIWYPHYKSATNKFISLLFYILIIIIHSMFISIKIYMITVQSTHYLYKIDDKFESQGSELFLDQRVLMLLTIISYTTFPFWIFEFQFNNIKWNGVADTIIVSLGYVLLISDLLLTIIIMCIYYSILIVFLYMIAVAFAVGFIYICVFIGISGCVITCCLQFQLYSLCCTPCLKCFGMTFRHTNLGFFMDFSGSFARFIGVTLIGIIVLTIHQNIWTFIHIFVWLFLEGPPQSVFYVDFNNTNDCVIYWFIIIAAQCGFIGLLIGLFNLCFPHCMKSNNEIRIGNDSVGDNNIVSIQSL